MYHSTCSQTAMHKVINYIQKSNKNMYGVNVPVAIIRLLRYHTGC